MLLMIDNYDSFTYNLVQYLGELGEDVRVFRNDEISLDEVAEMGPERIVLSPGPCTPNEAGITLGLIRQIRRAHPDSGRLPRTPGHRPGFRGESGARQTGNARQDLADRAFRPRRVP